MQQSSVYTDSLRLEEWHIYGSSRIGIYQTNKAMAQRTVRIENGVTTQLSNTHIELLSLSRFYTERGAKRYELTNHLGNVLTVVTDKKLPVCSGTSVSYFIADVVSATDYSPFGAPLAERTWQGSEYRYGFNSTEKDNEINGTFNAYDFGARIFDSRLGRWMSVDPKIDLYPEYSPFSYAMLNPLFLLDLGGKEVVVFWTFNKLNKPVMNIKITGIVINNGKGVASPDEVKNAIAQLQNEMNFIYNNFSDSKKYLFQVNVILDFRSGQQNNIKSDDHTIYLVPPSVFSNSSAPEGSEVPAKAEIGGRVAYFASSRNSVFTSMIQNGAHELGHWLGLRHPFETNFNSLYSERNFMRWYSGNLNSNGFQFLQVNDFYKRKMLNRGYSMGNPEDPFSNFSILNLEVNEKLPADDYLNNPGQFDQENSELTNTYRNRSKGAGSGIYYEFKEEQNNVE